MNPNSIGKKPLQANQRLAGQLMGPSNLPIGYFNMPKAACTTIKNILYYIQHGEWHNDPLAIHKNFKHKNVILRGQEFQLHRQNNPFERPYTIFTFVRNPSLRIYSAFVEKIWATGPYSFPIIRDILKETEDYQLPSLESTHFSIEDVRCGFKQFLRFVVRNLDGKTKMQPNPHWVCQYKRLQRLSIEDHLGFIGRVETFEEDMSFILKKSGWEDLSISRQRFNEGPRPPYQLNDLIDDEIAETLNKIYQADYIAFDYELCPSASKHRKA